MNHLIVYYIQLILFSLLLLSVYTQEDNATYQNIESPLCCNLTTTTEEVKLEYTSKIIENEYIVQFDGYYKSNTRENYITAALNLSSISEWRIISRKNPASDYPSDFDVVLFKDNENFDGLNALRDHPSIKRVTSQRIVHRTLKFINRRGRSSLSTNNQFWQATGRHTSRRLLRAIPRQITSVLQADALWNMGNSSIIKILYAY